MSLDSIPECSPELLQLLVAQGLSTAEDVLLSDPFQIYRDMPSSNVSLSQIRKLKDTVALMTSVSGVDAHTLLETQENFCPDDLGSLSLQTIPTLLGHNAVIELSGDNYSGKSVCRSIIFGIHS